MEYPKLPKRFKKKWVAALRSGEYKQGKHTLTHKNVITGERTYCCLGVACHIVGVSDKKMGGFGTIPSRIAFKKVPDILKADILRSALISKLTNMNDEGKHSFKRIATWIEKYL